MANPRQPFRHQQEGWSVTRRYGAAALHVSSSKHQDQLRLSVSVVPKDLFVGTEDLALIVSVESCQQSKSPGVLR